MAFSKWVFVIAIAIVVVGFLINVGRGQYDTALVFVGVFTLVVLALSLYGIVLFMEKRLLRWQVD